MPPRPIKLWSLALQVPPTISESDLRALAMSQENVIAELAGREPKVVIVRPPKIVNIVLG